MPERPSRLHSLRGAAEPDDGVRALLGSPDNRPGERAVDLHRAVVRPGERILCFLVGAPLRGRQFMTGAAIPTGLQHHASLYSRLLAARLGPSWHTRSPARTRPWAGRPRSRMPPRREPARTAAAPAAFTWYQYAVALPSQNVQCPLRAAARRTVPLDRAGQPRRPARWRESRTRDPCRSGPAGARAAAARPAPHRPPVLQASHCTRSRAASDPQSMKSSADMSMIRQRPGTTRAMIAAPASAAPIMSRFEELQHDTNRFFSLRWP
jgi:hypothetical protein